jgi:hypothetical protein
MKSSVRPYSPVSRHCPSGPLPGESELPSRGASRADVCDKKTAGHSQVDWSLLALLEGACGIRLPEEHTNTQELRSRGTVWLLKMSVGLRMNSEEAAQLQESTDPTAVSKSHHCWVLGLTCDRPPGRFVTCITQGSAATAQAGGIRQAWGPAGLASWQSPSLNLRSGRRAPLKKVSKLGSQHC